MSSPKEYRLPLEEGKYEIPVLGSLGLLALGYKGILAWRNVRDQKPAQRNDQQADGQNVNTTSDDDSKRNS